MSGGIELNVSRQMRLAETELAPFLDEFYGDDCAALTARLGSPGNTLYCGPDAALLYAMIRAARPRLLLEYGAGYSTLVIAEALRANERQGSSAHYVSHDPHPSAFLREVLDEFDIAFRREPVCEGCSTSAESCAPVTSSSSTRATRSEPAATSTPSSTRSCRCSQPAFSSTSTTSSCHGTIHLPGCPEAPIPPSSTCSRRTSGNRSYEIVFASFALSRTEPERLRALMRDLTPAGWPGSFWLRRLSATGSGRQEFAGGDPTVAQSAIGDGRRHQESHRLALAAPLVPLQQSPEQDRPARPSGSL